MNVPERVAGLDEPDGRVGGQLVGGHGTAGQQDLAGRQRHGGAAGVEGAYEAAALAAEGEAAGRRAVPLEALTAEGRMGLAQLQGLPVEREHRAGVLEL